MPDSILPPPSQTAPKLESISQADLAREIGGAPPAAKTEAPPPREKAMFSEPGKGTTRIGDDRGNVISKDMESFGDEARKMMAKKEAEARGEAPKEEAKPEKKTVKKEEPALKKEEAPKKEEAKKADGDPAPELTVADLEKMADDPHTKPSDAVRWKKLLYERRQSFERAEKAEARVKEIEDAARANPPQTAEELAKLRDEHAKASDELLKYRRRYEIDNDAEFKAKYDEPSAHAESAIESTLKKVGVAEGTLKVIKDAGGFAAFSRSTTTYPIEKVVDGEKVIEQVTAAELARRWMGAIPVADAEFIKQAVGKQQMLAEDKAVATKKAVDDAKTFFEARSAEQAKATQAAAATQKQIADSYQKFATETAEKTDWLKDKPVPDNATAEQKAEIEKHNEFTKDLRGRLTKHPTNVQEYQALVLDAVQSHHLRREAGATEARIKELESEVARLKGGMKTTGKGGSLLARKPDAQEKDKVDEDWKGGLRKGMERIASGGDE